jgi:hypothetical protein
MSKLGRIFLIGIATLLGSAVSGVALCNVRLAFDSASLDFGNAPLAGSRTLTLEVWDTASVNIQIDRFDLTGANAGDFSVASDSMTPFVALADSGNKVKIYVTFSPQANGPRSGFLEVETSDGNVFISLSGVGGVRSSLKWSLTAIDFGLLGPGATRDTVIELFSLGPDSAYIDGIQIASADASFQAQTVSAAQPPLVLAPGDSLAIKVSFEGLLPVGAKDAQVTVFGATLNDAQCMLTGDVEYGSFDIVPHDTVNFGTMYAGQEHDTTIFIENTSAVSIKIDDVGIAGDDFTILSAVDTQHLVPAGSEIPITIRANPGLKTSHSSAFYAVSQSASITYQSTELVVSVVLPSLSAPQNQDLSYFCAVSGPVQLTLPISDTGSGSIVITNFISNDTNVVVLANPSLPDTLVAGENQSLTLQFDPTKIVDSPFVIEGLGGEQIMIADTVSLQPKVSVARSSISSLAGQNGIQENFEIGSASSLAPFGIDTIIVHVLVEDTNVAAISSSDIKLSSNLPNATITSIQTEPGGYAVTVVSSTPITLAAGSSLLTVGFSRFVSTADSSNVFVGIETPEKAGCLVWNLDTSVVQGASVCGSTIMQDDMTGSPIILSADMRENPVTKGYADVSIFASTPIPQARYSLFNALGESMYDGTVDIVAGQNFREFPLSGLPSGAYVLRIVSNDGSSIRLRLLKLD